MKYIIGNISILDKKEDFISFYVKSNILSDEEIKISIFPSDNPTLKIKDGDSICLVLQEAYNPLKESDTGNKQFDVWYFIHNGNIYHYSKIEKNGVLNTPKIY